MKWWKLVLTWVVRWFSLLMIVGTLFYLFIDYRSSTQADSLLSLGSMLAYALDQVLAIAMICLFSIILIAPFSKQILVALQKGSRDYQIKRAFKNGGGIYQAKISEIKETRRWWKNKTYVHLSVVYEFEQETFVAEVRKITDLMIIPDIGHAIDIVYDPKKDKVYLARGLSPTMLKR